ncbi:MAG: ATP synthase F1 subunit gamma [Patescibacteria group bacterium]
MGVNTKAIKRRIKSVGSIEKITKAMEMVAAAKMRKAVSAALDTRTYATLAWDLLVNLSITQKAVLPLLDIRPVKKLLIILITSNRGMCGSFNSNIIRKTAEQLKNPQNISKQRIKGVDVKPSEKVEVDVVGIGKKGADFAKKMGANLIASFTQLSDTPTFEDVMPISRMIIEEYEKKNYDKVVVAYTDFKSTIAQVAKLRQVLPISEVDLEKMISELGQNKPEEKVKEDSKQLALRHYLFEPNKGEVLKIILPRLVETQIYQAMLESNASEHSARMMAMRNAADAADDIIKELELNFNKARQASITQEIAEISGGAAALG